MKPDLGIYYEMLDAVAATQPSLSFLAKPWPDIEAWRSMAREKAFKLLAFEPTKVPLNPSIEGRREEEDLIVEEISYDMPYGPRTHGFFLYPKKRDAKLRAVVALHDHGEFFYYGKEKITNIREEPKILREYKEKYYGGRGWATELAKRGFAVLVIDVFLWGSRKIPIDTVNEGLAAKLFEDVELDSEEYIRKYNEFWATSECTLVADTILNAGTSWPGIFGYEDRRSIDYLLTRPEIDPNRIACGGLSMGGLRTIFLAGLDARVQCGFCVGFMSTTHALIRNHIRCPPGHGLLMYVPGLFSSLDLPDIIALKAPAPLLVQYNRDDELFTLKGQYEADRKLAEIYSKIGRPENYAGKFYPGAHKFNVAMQEEVFEWLEGCLAKH
ncbi:MAG: alpha/beta hydrolase family protein [Candidatus Bathyarchaeia archaeon]|jgi:dienelactone hydrolase